MNSVILIYASVKLPHIVKSTQSSMNSVEDNVMSSLNNINPLMNQISDIIKKTDIEDFNLTTYQKEFGELSDYIYIQIGTIIASINELNSNLLKICDYASIPCN